MQALLYTLTSWHSREIATPTFFLRGETLNALDTWTRESLPLNIPLAWPGRPPTSSVLVSGSYRVSQIPVLSERHWLQGFQGALLSCNKCDWGLFSSMYLSALLRGIGLCFYSLLLFLGLPSKDYQAVLCLCFLPCTLMLPPKIEPSYSFSFGVDTLSLHSFIWTLSLFIPKVQHSSYLNPDQVLVSISFILTPLLPEYILFAPACYIASALSSQLRTDLDTLSWWSSF